MQALTSDVLIIGGGIVGASAACFLSRRGRSAIVCDAGQCGAKASGVNFGGVRRQGRPVAQMPLARRSHQLWANLRQLIGIDGEYVRSGHLKLAMTQADLEALAAYNRQVADFDLGLQLLDAADIRRHYPWVSHHVAGGSLSPQDGQANPRLVSPALAWAARQAGARLLENSPIIASRYDGSYFLSETSNGCHIRSRFVVNTAGAWAGQVAEWFGESLPVTEIYPQMGVTEPLPPLMDVVLGMQGGGLYARQVERGNVVFGGSRARRGNHGFAVPAHQSIGMLLQRLGQVIPALAGANVIRFWSGVEGATPDANPFLGASRTTPGLFHGFGYSGAGFQIGLASGEVLAELIDTGSTQIPIEAFRVDRFTADSGKL